MITLKETSNCFNRAFSHSFSKKIYITTFSFLFACGILFFLLQSNTFKENYQLSSALKLLPIFLSLSLFPLLGIFLLKLYLSNVKHMQTPYKTIFVQSIHTFTQTAFLSFFPLLAYICLLFFLGIFSLIKCLPILGPIAKTTLSFIPFLMNLSSTLLIVVNVSVLFFILPMIAFLPKEHLPSLKEQILKVKKNMFFSLRGFFIAVFPVVLIFGLLCFSNNTPLMTTELLPNLFNRFFSMIIYCILLTPAVNFFFNFAGEHYNFFIKQNLEQ